MMKTLILCYLLVLAARLGLHALNNRYLRDHGHEVPKPFAGVIDAERLATASDYTLTKGRFGLWHSLFDAGCTLVFYFGGLLPWYDRLVASWGMGFVASGVLFFLGLMGAQAILAIPFDLYSHFRIEERFGFNRMTMKLWIADQLKGLVISTILFGLLASGAFWLMAASPDFWWFWVWLLLVGFALLIMVIAPKLIEPLFFKFEPLQVEGLEEEIRAMMERAGLSLKKVLQVDASKRSGHSNAYFTGIGRQKRVVLFDTLLAQLSQGEILAVLAHELGHMVKHHVRRRLIWMILFALGYCYGAYALLGWEGLPALIGADAASVPARLLILALVTGLLTFPLTPIFSLLSRRDEYQADRYVSELHGNPLELASALATMSRENLANLHPHPFYARWYYSHPPVVERVVRLQEPAKG